MYLAPLRLSLGVIPGATSDLLFQIIASSDHHIRFSGSRLDLFVPRRLFVLLLVIP
jgi:hypothetical protein